MAYPKETAMSALQNLNKLFQHFAVDLRHPRDGVCEVWTTLTTGTYVIDPVPIGSIKTDGDAITGFNDPGYNRRTTIGRFGEFLHYMIAYGIVIDDVYELKLECRKLGKLVEVNVVSLSSNWWTLDEEDDSVIHEEVGIRAIEAQFLYDPSRDVLLPL
jgi:hypothetical protein